MIPQVQLLDPQATSPTNSLPPLRPAGADSGDGRGSGGEKVCSEDMGFIGFGGLSEAASLEMGKATIEWEEAILVPFDPTDAGTFGCSLSYKLIFQATGDKLEVDASNSVL